MRQSLNPATPWHPAMVGYFAPRAAGHPAAVHALCLRDIAIGWAESAYVSARILAHAARVGLSR